MQLVLPWLARQPHEPVLLNYVGVALYGLNEPALAIRLFEAAERLDPTTENLRGNLEAAAQASAPARRALTLRSSLAIALRALAALARARGEAGAHAACREVSISLCMIVRDEEEMLADCLESCARPASTR